MTGPTEPSDRARRGRAQTAIALICVGLLFLVPSGVCTAYFGLALLGDKYFPAVLVVGGPPIVLGAVFLFVGLRLRRR